MSELPRSTARIRVLVVDDHHVVRQGFAVFIRAFADFEWVGEASNGAEAVQCYTQLRPDVVLMDMIMPGMDGVAAIRAIRQVHPDARVIALTSFTDDKQLVQRAIEAGAISYLFKDVSVNDLANAIRAAHNGVSTFAPEATRMLIQAKIQRAPEDFNLSEREVEVLRLMAQGLNNLQIAEKLIISRSTVKFHVSSILNKLGAVTRTEAVTLAHQNKLLS